MSLVKGNGAGEVSTGFYNEIVEQSARFRQPDSSYLYRNNSGDGNRRTMSFSWWYKRGQATIGSYNIGEFFNHGGAGAGGTQSSARITLESNKFNLAHEDNNSTSWELISNGLFRDHAQFYHFFVAIDTTQSTASNRVRVYLNGTEITDWSTSTYPSQNADLRFGQAKHYIGVSEASGNPWSATYLDGYMCDVIYIDGTALTPSSFGEFKNGIWIAKEYTGSYGTNGHRLEFKNTTAGGASPSSSTIGADTSGNNNHYNDYNFSSHDSNLLDSPENNFCTLEPNFRAVTANTLSEANLKCVTSTSGRSFSAGTFRMTTGKWYWEFRPDANSGGMGVAKINGANGGGAYQSTTSTSTSTNTTDYYYGETNWVMYGDGIVHNATFVGGTGSGMGSPSYPQIWGIGIDLDSDPKTITYYIDGSSVGSANLDSGFDYIPIVGDGSGAVSRTIHINFGQNPTFNGTETAGTNTDGNGNGLFHDSVPSGYLALCSANLPDVTVGPDSTSQADDHFNTVLYSGDNGTQSVTGVGFKPDFLWIKSRNVNASHTLFDSTRGVTKSLFTNVTSLEVEYSSSSGNGEGVTTFGSDGFTVKHDATNNQFNVSSRTYAAFNWKANGGTTTTNDASSTGIGTIDSVFQANDDAGFSIVTYTGTGSAGTVRHGLSVAPSLVIIKSRTTASPSNWVIGQDQSGFTGQNYFTDTSAFGTNSGSFNNTAPTTSVVSIGTDQTTNGNTATYVMYCFANVEGFCKIGSYEMNSNVDGPLVYTGFRPAWLLTRPVDQAGNWSIYDTVREPFNDGDNDMFFVESTSAESGFGTSAVDFVSNGFKIRHYSAGYSNIASNTAIYLAFAEQPFKFSNAR